MESDEYQSIGTVLFDNSEQIISPQRRKESKGNTPSFRRMPE